MEFNGERDAEPRHVWLRLEPDIGWVQFHARGGIEIAAEDPYASSRIDNAGVQTVVAPVDAEHLPASVVGQRVVDAVPLVAVDDDEWENGLVLHFDSGTAVAILDASTSSRFTSGFQPESRSGATSSYAQGRPPTRRVFVGSVIGVPTRWRGGAYLSPTERPGRREGC